MSEQEPNPPQRDTDSAPWDVDLAGAERVLGTPAEQHRHPLFGDGLRWTFGEGTPLGKAQLELYRAPTLARFWSGWLRADLGNVTRVAPEHAALQVESVEEHHRTRLLIDLELGVAIHRITHADAPSEPVTSSPTAPPAIEVSRTPQPPTPAVETSRPDAREPTQERPPRVLLTGRIGRTPRLKTTSGGRTVAQIPLAVHQGEQTNWHTILFFDAAAEQAVERLAKGQLITIVGYRHQREITTRKGETRTVEEIYAAAVQGQGQPDRPTS